MALLLLFIYYKDKLPSTSLLHPGFNGLRRAGNSAAGGDGGAGSVPLRVRTSLPILGCPPEPALPPRLVTSANGALQELG